MKKIDSKKYDPSTIEPKWQSKWEKDRLYHSDLQTAKRPFYNLMMFPYPSAEGLHIGGMRTFAGVDIYGRFKRMQGHDVFQPFGLDGFGIHAENYALKIGENPMKQAAVTEKNFYRQISESAIGVDWSRTVETYKPDYYKWTQWIFTELFKEGLAYRKKSPVNYCPSCKTVLADEQVIDGKCERCSSIVEKKNLEQWFFRITSYADRLLSNIDSSPRAENDAGHGGAGLNWTEKVKIAQRNWIGKSEGLIFTAPVKDSDMKIQTFSAHFEAFKADTFVVIAPDHPILEKLIENVPNKQEILDFSQKILNKRKEDGFTEDKNPEGIFTGKYIVDPVGNGDLPIWVASYALSEYGTGIVKCSAHDERDFAFAKKYGIKLKPVLFPQDPKLKGKVVNLEICYTDMKNGILSEPDEFVGRRAGAVRKEIIEHVVKKGFAKPISQYHLRDWLISRQRYWGPPIPMVYCQSCASKGHSWFTSSDAKKEKGMGISNFKFQISNSAAEAVGWYPVPEKDLPVELPYIEDFKPLGTGGSPLANHPEFYEADCPECGKPARRETDVSDTFLDSSWYFLRYLATDWDDIPFPSVELAKSKKQKAIHSASSGQGSKEEIENFKLKIENSAQRAAWLPVHMYIGGAEHSVLHLLYARFITMFLKDKGKISFEEPFARFFAHGLIIKEGAKMSKSKGNVVGPDVYIKKFGADTLRTYLHFLAPFNQDGDFRDSGVEGMNRFLKKVWNLFSMRLEAELQTGIPEENLRMMHQTIKNVTGEMEELRFNTSIAFLMTYYNFLVKQENISKDELEVYLLMLSPFAPHLTEELWCQLGNKQSIHLQKWPKYDEKHLVSDTVKIPVQVNGKLRSMVEVLTSDISDKVKIEKIAKLDVNTAKFLEGQTVKKLIYIEGKVINFVI